MYTQVICLANSWKHSDRCIAGIEINTGKWIRPVTSLEDGRIPKQVRLIDNNEPTSLDILEIPLAETGPNFGFASENRLILPGTWRKVGKVQPADLMKYVNENNYILHNAKKYIVVSFLQAQPTPQRQTLQLIYATKFYIKGSARAKGGKLWKGTIIGQNEQQLFDANITDPIFCEKLDAGYVPQNPCLITISLSMPWRPKDWEGEDPCWKLIAGVIELTNESLPLSFQDEKNPISIPEAYTGQCLYTFSGQAPISINPDNNLIACSNDIDINAMKFWDLQTGKLIKTLNIHAVDFSPSVINSDASILVNIADGNTIQLWNLNNGHLIRSFIDNSPEMNLNTVALSQDRKYLASANISSNTHLTNTSIQVWEQDINKKMLYQLNIKVGCEQFINYQAVEFSPNNDIIASKIVTHTNNFLGLWSIRTGEYITTIGTGDNVNAFAFSPDSRLIVTVNQDGSIRFWDLNNYQSILNITGRGKPIDCVSFSPDSQMIAASSQNVIKLWNVSNGHLLLTLDSHEDTITSLIFSPDGKLLVSSSKDAQIKLWSLSKSRQDNYLNRKIEYDMSMIPY